MRSDQPGYEIALTHLRRMIEHNYATLDEFGAAVAELKKQRRKKPVA